MAEKKGPEKTERAAAAPRVRHVRVRWTPVGSNQTSRRELGPYAWAPGEVVEVEESWWKEQQDGIARSPRDLFEVLTAAEAKELEEAEAAPPAPEAEGEAISNPTPAAGE